MAWELLPTDYTDAVWDGLKRYTQIDNDDGTVSFRDDTTYTGKEKSFFGAKDANRMNEALNTIMSMVENGTDLYEEFQNYFAGQKTHFESKAEEVVNGVKALTNEQYDSYKTYVEGLKKEGDQTLSDIESGYEQRMSTYEGEQKALFDAWFAAIKEQLSEDVAGSLQNQLTEVEERLSHMEHMAIKNDFIAPIEVKDGDEGTIVILGDDLGNAVVADWKYEEV